MAALTVAVEEILDEVIAERRYKCKVSTSHVLLEGAASTAVILPVLLVY